jgi:lipopolysaccharide transport system permease protein
MSLDPQMQYLLDQFAGAFALDFAQLDAGTYRNLADQGLPGLAPLALAGFVLAIANIAWSSLLLGVLCVRFRDLPPIVGSLMQIAFFVTPVIWKPELLSPARLRWLPLNPFYNLLEVVRVPLLGGTASVTVWVAALGYSLVLIAITWALFVRVRGRLAFWV